MVVVIVIMAPFWFPRLALPPYAPALSPAVPWKVLTTAAVAVSTRLTAAEASSVRLTAEEAFLASGLLFGVCAC